MLAGLVHTSYLMSGGWLSPEGGWNMVCLLHVLSWWEWLCSGFFTVLNFFYRLTTYTRELDVTSDGDK